MNIDVESPEALEFADAVEDLIAFICNDDPTMQDLTNSLRAYSSHEASDIVKAYFMRKTELIRTFLAKEVKNNGERH